MHATWWLYDDCLGLRSRFRHGEEESEQIVSTLEELEVHADTLFQYASMLDDLLDEDWPRAMLLSRSGVATAPRDHPGDR